MVEGWRLVCFTDQDLQSDTWEIVRMPIKNKDAAKTAREVKINFHRYIDSQYSLWIDATFVINIHLDTWWQSFKPPFTTIKHPFDNCIYKEILNCQRSGKGAYHILSKQRDAYTKAKVPKNIGLIASGILMRENTPRVQRFCELWASEVQRWTARDQIAFGYAHYMMPGVHQSIVWDYTRQREFIHIPHLHKKRNNLLYKYPFLNA
jgi:hypothetical protein